MPLPDPNRVCEISSACTRWDPSLESCPGSFAPGAGGGGGGGALGRGFGQLQTFPGIDISSNSLQYSTCKVPAELGNLSSNMVVVNNGDRTMLLMMKMQISSTFIVDVIKQGEGELRKGHRFQVQHSNLSCQSSFAQSESHYNSFATFLNKY
jgi:hypothetical protein